MTAPAVVAVRADPAVYPERLPQRHHTPRPVDDPCRSDQVTPRIDSISVCAGCPDLVVYDEVFGWIHTGQPSTTSATPDRIPLA